jgi:hypothetical protein
MEAESRTFRFRTDPDPRGTDLTRRRWQARYSHDEGWAPFEISLDMDAGECTVGRVQGTDYSALRKDLARALLGVEPPTPGSVEPAPTVTLPIRLVGPKMSRSAAPGSPSPASGPFRSQPSGDWLVVEIMSPDGEGLFFLGVNDRLGAGEIATTRPESVPAVLEALGPAFV